MSYEVLVYHANCLPDQLLIGQHVIKCHVTRAITDHAHIDHVIGACSASFQTPINVVSTRPPYMRPYDQSSQDSPVKKKRRLSSPGNVAQSSSQDALEGPFVQPMLGFSKSTTLLSLNIASSSNHDDDSDNPFANPIPPIVKASSIPLDFGFAPASKISIIESREHPPSPESPPEQDYDEWFKPSAGVPFPGFRPAIAGGFASASSATPQPTGFVSLRPQAALVPSAAALAKAQAKMKDIWNEDSHDVENIDPLNKTKGTFTTPAPVITHFHRPALQRLENELQTPGTPSPAAPPCSAAPQKPRTVDQLGMRQKPFRSPLMTRNTQGPGATNSPLISKVGSSSAASVSSQRPTPTTTFTPVRPVAPSPSFTDTRTPLRALPPRSIPAPFVTPFKPGMRPGEPGWTKLQDSTRKGGSQNRSRAPFHSNNITPARQPIAIQYKSFFDLRPPSNRKTLATSGLGPQQFAQEDFESMDINIQELQRITPLLAVYYSFHTESTLPPSETEPPARSLGPSTALKELHDLGCTLATRPWIENHWGLILWKLAGMVALDPDSESDPKTKRWCWTEVRRQLLYRYERELNQAARPALRLISTQDAPASYPLALCVSNILWIEPENQQGVSYPELEVTDGWYRLRAKIDLPMTRAVKRGIIRVGRKLGVAGARLDSERKEPREVLDAYNSVKLVLSGNSSHLLSWDAKLGFMKGPCISTMHKLTPDGGPIAAMDVVVVKTHALAFIEFFVEPNGRRRREGPRGEAEEMRINEGWKKRRDLEASKLRTELEKKIARYESYIDKLERRAGNHFHPHPDDDAPDHIDKLYDQLEEHDDAMRVLNRIGPHDAGWLARHTRRCLDLEQERAGEDISRELEVICPSRDVRSFRVIVVEDSQTCRRPANRHAQLTVWDVLSLTLSEGTQAGTIKSGSRFLITNLIPQQQGAWMGTQPNSQIFLATTRATKWRRLNSG